MAVRLLPLLATQVAWDRFPIPARPTFSVEKVDLFCNPASGGMFSSTAIEIIKRIHALKKKISSLLNGHPSNIFSELQSLAFALSHVLSCFKKGITHFRVNILQISFYLDAAKINLFSAKRKKCSIVAANFVSSKSLLKAATLCLLQFQKLGDGDAIAQTLIRSPRPEYKTAVVFFFLPLLSFRQTGRL
jgi:hypothetical protein